MTPAFPELYLKAQGGNEELEKVVLGLVEKVDFAAASEADKRDGPAGPSSSQSAALRRLVVAMWNKVPSHIYVHQRPSRGFDKDGVGANREAIIPQPRVGTAGSRALLIQALQPR